MLGSRVSDFGFWIYVGLQGLGCYVFGFRVYILLMDKILHYPL